MQRVARTIRLLVAVAALAGCEHRRSYTRHPLIREMKVTAGPISDPETATQAEPYPPPRPILPVEPSNVAAAPNIQMPGRSPAP